MRTIAAPIVGGALLAAGLGLGAPAANAVPVFQNCSEANAAGYYNIPASGPVYRLKFDRDRDGVGCDHPDPTKRGTYIHPDEPAPKPNPEPRPNPDPKPEPAPKPNPQPDTNPAPPQGPVSETGYVATPDRTGLALAGGSALLLAGGLVTLTGARATRR